MPDDIFKVDLTKSQQLPKEWLVDGKKIQQRMGDEFEVNDIKNSNAILVIGEQGAGKTSFINSYASYLWGVKYNDSKRYILSHSEDGNGSDRIQGYFIKPKYIQDPVVLIDTPGFKAN